VQDVAQIPDVRSGTHSGLKSDIALLREVRHKQTFRDNALSEQDYNLRMRILTEIGIRGDRLFKLRRTPGGEMPPKSEPLLSALVALQIFERTPLLVIAVEIELTHVLERALLVAQ